MKSKCSMKIKRQLPKPLDIERNYHKRPCMVTGEGKYIKVLPSTYRPTPAPIPKPRPKKPKTDYRKDDKVQRAVRAGKCRWWTEERVNQLIELHRQGLKYEYIAIRLGTNKNAVTSKVKSLIDRGILKARVEKPLWTDEDFQTLERLKANGKTWAEIGDVLGRNANACYMAWNRRVKEQNE